MLKHIVGIVGISLLTTAVAWGHAPDSHFRIDVEPGLAGDGSSVTGYVWNTYGQVADHVWITIQGLDATGKVVGTTAQHVGLVPNDDRVYFSAEPIQGAARYRAQIASFECLVR
jgi:hypothetical protein